MSFVGAANSPDGISINFHGIKAPAKFDPKTKRKIVAVNGKNWEYYEGPICVNAILLTKS